MANSPVVMDIDSSKMDKYWVDSPNQCPPFERNLNFVALGNDDDDYSFSKKKSARDPMSHRIIEKRRRDRMNNCLADLSKLLPEAYLKRGRGRIEKTEIIEMAIKHLKHLQAHACKDMDHCEIVKSMESSSNAKSDQYRSGFTECMSELVQFLVEVEGFYPEDPLCVRLSNHLQNHCEKIMRSGEVSFSGSSGDIKSPLASTASSLINGSASSNDEGVGSSISNANGSASFASQSTLTPADERSSSRKFFNGRENDDDSGTKEEQRNALFLSNNYANQSGSDDQNSRNGGGSSSASADGDDIAVGASACGSGSRAQNSASNSTPSPDNQEEVSSPADLTDSSSPTSHSGGSHHHSSNLRDMLLSSSADQSSSSSRAKSNCSSNSNSSRCNDDSMGMYKFKTNIHQRFTADLEHVYPNPPAQQQQQPQQSTNCSDAHESYKMQSQGQAAKRRKIGQDDRHHIVYSPSGSSWNSNECYTSSDSDAQRLRERTRSLSPGQTITPPPSSTFAWPKEKPMDMITTKLETEFPKHLETVVVGEPKSEYHHQQQVNQFNTKFKPQQLQQQRSECGSPASPNAGALGAENGNVPIFALHPKGSFYVPMSVQLSLIEPLFNPPSSDALKAQSIFHPVTITVNFCHPLRVLTAKPVDSGLLLRPIALQQQQQQQQPQPQPQPQPPRHPHELLVNNLDRRRPMNEHPVAFHHQPPMALPSPSIMTPPDADHRSKRHPYDLEAESRAHFEQVARIRGYPMRQQELPSPRVMRLPDHVEQGAILFRMPQESYENHGQLTTSDGRRLPREMAEAVSPRPANINSCSNGVIGGRPREPSSSSGNSSRWSHLMAANRRTHTP